MRSHGDRLFRYEFGIFEQVIRDGWQCEMTDKWLKNGNPWDIARSEIAYEVKFGGHTEAWGTSRAASACAGFQRRRCAASPTTQGDYDRAVEDKVESETITKVLYPNGEEHQGKVLRLKQRFFFTSCSLQNMLRIQTLLGGTPATFHER